MLVDRQRKLKLLQSLRNADADSAGAVLQSQFEVTGFDCSSSHFDQEGMLLNLASACGLDETDPRRNEPGLL